jgi:hypothetical protein
MARPAARDLTVPGRTVGDALADLAAKAALDVKPRLVATAGGRDTATHQSN